MIVDGQERLETLVEHVCNPNGVASLKDKYICSNKDCLTHSFGVCWNEYGEKYSLRHHDKSFYVDGNDAPFGSFGRKTNVEIYSDGSGVVKREESSKEVVLMDFDNLAEVQRKLDMFDAGIYIEYRE